MVQALENAPSHNFTKLDLNQMVEEAVRKGALITLGEIRTEMSMLKDENLEEAKVYTNKVQAKSK